MIKTDFQYRGDRLHVGSISLEQIADVTGTPVYVYSSDALLRSFNELRAGLSSIDHLICFAVKSNSNLAVLDLLGRAGAGMDLVSGGELYRASAVGIAPERIVFSGVGKTPGEMADALELGGKGIFSFNVESVEELAVLAQVARKLGKTAPVALRFNPDVNAKTHPYISTGLKKNKFGLNRAEILGICGKIRDYPGISLNGISIHIGSQLLSLSPLNDAFGRVSALMGEMEAILKKPLSHLDLGGGLGIPYHREKSPRTRQYCSLILKHFGPRSKAARARGMSGLKILIEPGRVIAGNAGALVTEVLYRKARPSKDFLIVDAGMNDLIRPALYDSYHEIIPVKRRGGALRKTDVVGPVCETGDFFARDRKLPSRLASGDLVAILSAGAYGFTMSGNYNSRPRPPEVLVGGGTFRVIRERETYEDLVRGESP